MSASTFTVPFDKPVENLFKKWALILRLLYGIPSLILMIFIFIRLSISKKYSNSFYRLVQMDLLINALCWANTWISVRSLDLEIGIKYLKFLENYLPGIWNVSAFLTNFFFHLQFCSSASLSIHRISSILFFSNFDKFWKRWYLLIDFIFVVYSCLPQLGGQPITVEMVNGSIYLTTNNQLWFANGTRLAMFSVVYFILLISLGITVARVAFKTFRGTNVDQGISKKLTKIALASGLVYSGILAWSIANYVQSWFAVLPIMIIEIGNSVMSLASDMMTLSLPYILLIFDTNIKRDLRISQELSNVVPVVAPTISW